MNDDWNPFADEPVREPQDLRQRTRAVALDIVHFFDSLPKTTVAQVLGKQMLRSGTSAGAHYREATRARSSAEFISKLEGGLQELEETCYWLELLEQAHIASPQQTSPRHVEANQLIAIFVSSVRTVKAKCRKRPKMPSQDDASER